MKRWIVCLLTALLFASISYTDQTQSTPQSQPAKPGRMGRHIPKTLIHENSARHLLKDGGPKVESSEPAICPANSQITGDDIGQEIGYNHSTEPNLPGYIKHYLAKLETRQNHVDTWETIVPGLEAHVKYCYYSNPENNFILIYVGPATQHPHP
jgi:hypothetical protein